MPKTKQDKMSDEFGELVFKWKRGGLSESDIIDAIIKVLCVFMGNITCVDCQRQSTLFVINRITEIMLHRIQELEEAEEAA